MKKILIATTLIASSLTLAACSSQPANNDNAQAVVDSNTLLASAGYQNYSATAVQDAEAAGKDVALFFHSKTCSSCKSLNDNIEANGNNIPSDVALFKVDWDDNQALAKEYKVDNYHTVRFLDKEENVKGLFTLDDVLAQFNEEPQEAPTTIKEEPTVEEDKVVAAQQAPQEEPTTAKEEPTAKANQYALYSEAAVQQAIDNSQRIVLNFKASRCPTCKATTEDIQSNISMLPNDVVILEADYDKYTELKREYKVLKQTTFVYLDAQGEYLQTVTNVRSMEDLISNL